MYCARMLNPTISHPGGKKHVDGLESNHSQMVVVYGIWFTCKEYTKC